MGRWSIIEFDPSHVRKQTGDFGNIFEETCKNKTEEVIIQWRRALTDVANTLGDNEAKMIEEIVSDVSDKLLLTPSEDSENFVGIEDHIANLSVLLRLDLEEVRMVGIGKTTIARVLFNRLSRHFQGRIFIDMAFLSKSMDIYSQANPYDYNMKLHLQSKFLSKILGKKDIEISQLGELAGRLKHHKVLVFIDDLNDQVVLDSLVGQTQWFGSGSRIIVVTNDKHFLRAHGIEHIYEVCLPSEDLAREILCRSAFSEKSPPEGVEELVYEITGLVVSPLGLTVLGSSLRGRDNEYWMDSLSMLQTGKNGEIEKISRISYDGLTSEEDKTIFRYIACYFNGGKVAYMKLLLADSGLSVNVGLENLADKSLIHVREGRVEMHGLLKKMGKKVVRLEKPENREFLEDSQDIFDVLSKGIELHVHENAFKRMRNLRFLEVLRSYGSVHALPYLKEMDLSYSHDLIQMPDLSKATNLETLKLVDCYSLVKLPSSIPHPNKLRKLNMKYCRNVETIPIGISLKSLEKLHLDGCSRLRTVPQISTNIVHLCLSETAIEEFPSDLHQENLRFEKLSYLSMKNLKSKKLWEKVQFIIVPLIFLKGIMAPSMRQLYLSDIPSLVELPSSFQNLRQLEKLEIENCLNLETIPTGINLKSLWKLNLSGCSRLRTFPDISTNIKYLYLNETAIEEVPCWIEKFTKQLEFFRWIHHLCQFHQLLKLGSRSSVLTEYTSGLSTMFVRRRSAFIFHSPYYCNLLLLLFNRPSTSQLSLKPIPQIQADFGTALIPLAQYFQKPEQIYSMKKSVKVKEWGIRLCSSADNRLGYPNTLPHVFQTDEGNTLNEAGHGKISGGEDEVTEPSSKRMRISCKKKNLE
ncbi:LOW QUALITY PROTEIN: hypothetical protein HID58_048768 [Brassica napus]|uniref:Disease resistance protein n=1 Tax=Brassica napus TaxID=3708 RepID=A0ABQ8B4L5_BRANA|nr:LOW QUALITY PROTEIN: hypothetical protein HID58_048768 [Brassica napus]